MELDWNETIAGYTMLQVRDLLKRFRYPMDLDDLSQLLGGGDHATLIAELQARGWLEQDSHGRFDTTVAGNAASMAKRLKPITRRDAERRLREVIAAAGEINADERYSHDVKRLAVFGSYLSDQETLNDLDIAYELGARWMGGSLESMQEAKARSNAAFPPPRSADWMGRLLWPEHVVLRKLKIDRRVSLEPLSTVEHYGWPHRLFALTSVGQG